MYGKNINGILYVRFEPTEGYKPMNQTEPPTVTEGYYLGFFWKETNDAFVQTWELLEIPTVSDDDELTDEQVGVVLTGGTL